jgi:hypothetical protein
MLAIAQHKGLTYRCKLLQGEPGMLMKVYSFMSSKRLWRCIGLSFVLCYFLG